MPDCLPNERIEQLVHLHLSHNSPTRAEIQSLAAEVKRNRSRIQVLETMRSKVEGILVDYLDSIQ